MNRSGGTQMDYQLSLTEYSAKYGVSVSTLRRKIKKEAILNKMVDGKYLLPDLDYKELSTQNIAPHSSHKVAVAPPQEFQRKNESVDYSDDHEEDGEELEPLVPTLGDVDFNENKSVNVSKREESIQHQSFDELKKAFRSILAEKEAQITSLKSHLADVQTLNKVLEFELARLEELLAEDSLKPNKTVLFTKHDY